MVRAFTAVELKNYNAILVPPIYQKRLAAVEAKQNLFAAVEAKLNFFFFFLNSNLLLK